MSFTPVLVASTALAVAIVGCRPSSQGRSSRPAPTSPDAGSGAAARAADRVVLDVTRDLGACVLGHRGVLVDFGDPSAHVLQSPGAPRLSGRDDDDVVEREGATWLRVRSRSLTVSFYWPAVAAAGVDAPAYVDARIRSTTARAVGIAIDGRTIGASTLVKGQTRVVVVRAPTPVTLSPGSHDLSLHFVGGARASGEPLAEVDWVHIGTGAPEEPYAAPTHADAAVDATVGDRSMRAVSLRAPGFVHCSGWIPANATLEVSLATAGGGDADVEALLVRDRRPPVVLGAARVSGDATAWAPWSVPVTGVEGDGALASVELVAARAPAGTRVLLGDPAVVASGVVSTPATTLARNIVLVVLGSTSARALAPWGGPHQAPQLAGEAAAGTTFDANRASSTLPNSVVASMLTGLPASALGLDDPDARLPDGPITVEEACRQGGVATAMFTANPTTGAAFGFDRGWDTFVLRDPLEDAPATRVFDDAAAWIASHAAGRFLVVVHARGGHPPWEASPDELRSMPPEGYLGVIEPSRAAEAIAKVRAHPARFKDDDRIRAWALYDHAIDLHDDALGRLLAGIRSAGREGDTLVIVTSDVAGNEALPVPFADSDTLDEPLLATPLVIRWPKAGALAGRRIQGPTSPIDLARTMLAALGLEPPTAFQGTDLATLARGALVPSERPLMATRGPRFSARWGPYVLLGSNGRETRICDLSLDPACIADIRATSPLALGSIERFAAGVLTARSPPPYPRAQAVLDERTKEALVRWGVRAADARDAAR